MTYKDTVFLPKTDFAMKAGLSEKEPKILSYWKDRELYKKLRSQAKDRKKFILHYGPPYANGTIHIGHVLTEVLKDIIVKTKQMQGFDAPLVPGWDCHGLPIEWKVEEAYNAKGIKKDDVPALELIEACRDFASKWIDIQREEFKRLGIIADWENPYVTMDKHIEAKIVEEASKFLLNGSLYRGLKPVLWSVVEKTALADAEMEYKDKTSDSIYVKFPIIKSNNPILEGAQALIWTTTPWTIPANRAICYGPDFDYSVLKLNDQKYVLAKDLVPTFIKLVGDDAVEHLAVIHGSDFDGSIAAHPWRGLGYDFDVPFLKGDHVTVESGTGLVHTAPSHGIEDFDVCHKNNIPVPEMVEDDGTYYDHVPLFAGQHVFKANILVIDQLKEVGALFHQEKITHSYPHSWRSKAPLIYRATPQWFISIDKNDLRTIALSEIDRIDFYPERGRTRIKSMVDGRPDWCLSRQRTWGVPLAVFIHNKTKEPLRDAAVQQRIVDAFQKHGVEAWHTLSNKEFLGDDYNPDDYSKIHDIVDVWFDSGCSHSYVLEDRPELSWPADLYLEGSDQHRGWFQSSLLQSCGTRGRAPYESIVTHGFTLDEKGYKMSKSSGNVVAPQTIINKMGADILRLWVVNSDYSEDQRIGPDILKQQEDIYRRFRNTLRYLLGALSGYKESESVEFNAMPSFEKWVLHRLSELDLLHNECVKKYDLMTFYNHLHTFCSQDLSAFYFDIRKDTLYCDHESDIKRRAARTVMNITFNHLIRWLAPVLSFTAEEAWHSYKGSDASSIHEQEFSPIPDEWNDNALGDYWKKLRHLRRVMTTALEIERHAKTIGSSLQAHIYVYVTAELSQFLESIALDELTITSKATLVVAAPPANALTLDDVKDIGVIVNSAEGKKCERCWKVVPEIGTIDRKHHDICDRCSSVVDQQG